MSSEAGQPIGSAPALEKIMRNVLAMEQAGDMEKLVELVWQVLEEQGYSFVSCSLALMDEQHDWMTLYSFWGRDLVGTRLDKLQGTRLVGSGLVRFVTQTSLSEASSWTRACVAAWRHQVVEQHVLAPDEIDELIRLAGERFGLSLTVAEYPIRYHLHVPGPHGTFTLRTSRVEADQFSSEQITFLRRVVDFISLGYDRYRQLQRIERERSAQQVRAEVQAMRASDDILDVLVMLRDELARVGVHFNYLSISVRDLGENVVHLYRMLADELHELARLTPSLRTLKGRTREAGDVNLLYDPMPGSVWDAESTRAKGMSRVTAEEAPAYWERMEKLWKTGDIPENMRVPLVSMLAPFPGGRINVGHFEVTPGDAAFTYTPEDLEVLEVFAEAIGMGFSRFADFQRLERCNRELAIEQAVEHVQNAVAGMNAGADLAAVVLLLTDQVRNLGLEHDNCTISVVDRQDDLVHICSAPDSQFLQAWEEITGSPPERTSGPEALEQLERHEGPLFIRGIPGMEERVFQYTNAPLDAYHGRIQEIEKTVISSRTEEEVDDLIPEYAKRWQLTTFPRELCPRAVLRSPFAGGTIALAHRLPRRYSEPDARILERFADAFSLGYARYLDFQRLDHANQALEAANELIREETRRKSDYLSRMSHDLRTPMNAIIGYTRILTRRLSGAIEDRQFRNLENIQTSADNLLSLINEILDLSRIEAGRIDLKPVSVDLCQLVAECIAAVAPLAKSGVEWVQELEDAPPVITDRDRIRRVVMNLLGNAVKFTEKGSITVSLRSVEEGLELAVADTGVGIPPEDLPHIFEEFRQVDRRVGEKTEGTGLGLAIAHRSVEMLGGAIRAESGVGEGTAFTVRIGDYEGT